jgi:hypothetical protein
VLAFVATIACSPQAAQGDVGGIALQFSVVWRHPCPADEAEAERPFKECAALLHVEDEELRRFATKGHDGSAATQVDQTRMAV